MPRRGAGPGTGERGTDRDPQPAAPARGARDEAGAADGRRPDAVRGDDAGDPGDGERGPEGTSVTVRTADGRGRLMPRWLAAGAAQAGAVLLVGLTVYLAFWVLATFGLVTVAVIVALLLAALLSPVPRRLKAMHVPSALASLLTLVFLLGVPLGVGFLVVRRATSQVDQLQQALTRGVDSIREWLITGPLGLDPATVDSVRDQVVSSIQMGAPAALSTAATLLRVLTGLILALFILFFLLKDGRGLWETVLRFVPQRHRHDVDVSGGHAWEALVHYTRGTVMVAFLDALGIGAVLFVLGVPLALSLSLLVFLGAFVPIIGATVSGVVAVLVTFVTNGSTDALVVAAAVIVVQQIEGNVFQPFIMEKQLRLHPVIIVLAVTIGTLLYGITGALVAVPVAAVVYRVVLDVVERRAPGQIDVHPQDEDDSGAPPHGTAPSDPSSGARAASPGG